MAGEVAGAPDPVATRTACLAASSDCYIFFPFFSFNSVRNACVSSRR